MASRLTKKRVDSAMPGETIWDGDIRGFGLRVSKGGAKSYVLKYRRGSLQRWLTIGRHGAPFTPESARREAQKLFGEIAAGKDPAKDREEYKDAETLIAFSERYIRDFSELYKKPKTALEEKRLLAKTILPVLGKIRVVDLQRSDIVAFHRRLNEKPYLANRCLSLISHMINTAEDWGIRPEGINPCRRIKRFPEKARERFLSFEELQRLGSALMDAERSGKSVFVTSAIRLLIFTGARLNEILTLKWDMVDFEARLLRLPDSKTGKKTIALAAPALDVLANLPREENNPYVICGCNPGAHLVNLQKPWRRIREQAELTDVRIHDLRHSFASVAVADGMSLPLIGSLLGHKHVQTTKRYTHLADNPRLSAAERVARRIAEQLSAKPKGYNNPSDNADSLLLGAT